MNIKKKNSIRIAVPTNDGINIFSGMLGMAKEMFIFEITNGTQFRLIEKRTNPYENTMQHLKTIDVYEIVQDCGIIVSAKIGKRGINRLREKGMNLFFRAGNIEQAIINVCSEERLDK